MLETVPMFFHVGKASPFSFMLNFLPYATISSDITSNERDTQADLSQIYLFFIVM